MITRVMKINRVVTPTLASIAVRLRLVALRCKPFPSADPLSEFAFRPESIVDAFFSIAICHSIFKTLLKVMLCEQAMAAKRSLNQGARGRDADQSEIPTRASFNNLEIQEVFPSRRPPQIPPIAESPAAAAAAVETMENAERPFSKRLWASVCKEAISSRRQARFISLSATRSCVRISSGVNLDFLPDIGSPFAIDRV